MSSFELKPQEHVGIGTNVDTLAWTVPREAVPVLLEGRISLSTWQDTFDKVVERYRFIFQSFSPWMLIPCFICCSMPKMMSITQESKRAWLALVEEQARVYRPAGVQVTLAKELYSMGTGSSRNMRNETVGLRFEIRPNVNANHSTGGNVRLAEGKSTMNNDLTAQLTQLATLHENGALTDEEYSRAKSQLLSK